MKRILLLSVLAITSTSILSAQGLKGLVKKATGQDTTTSSNKGTNILNQVTGGGKGSGSLTNDEVVGGLKEALVKGTDIGSKRISAVDGFFKDAAIKILMPEEAKKAEKTLRNFGLGKQVDDAILSMNRAAEDAAKSAAPIFSSAIKNMSFQDAWAILKGGDSAATKYLREKTSPELTAAFRPVIEKSLEKTSATKYWNTVFTSYNKFSSEKVNTDLAAYVTEKALAGMFYQVALEEMKIRKDPVARTSELLKKVFAK